jgi:uncharacterized protein (DUF362 family)
VAGVGAVHGLFHDADADGVDVPRPGTPRSVDTRVPVEPDAPVLATVRGRDYGRAVEIAVDALGGMTRFVRPGETVVVKPNIGWDRLPVHGANTHPEVVAAVVRLCRDARAGRVIVVDVPCNEARRCYERSGIRRAAEDAGAEVILPGDGLADEVELAGEGLGTWKVLRPILEADRLINVPVVKHHGMARVTAGMKNWYGALVERRSLLHQRMDEGIAALAATFRPALTVLDATRVMIRNGPQGGALADVEQRDLVGASTDPVAADVWAIGLLGRTIEEIPYVEAAARAGLGSIRLDAANHREIEP